MTGFVLLLAVLAGAISASTIRDYTGGNQVDDIFDHQDNIGTSQGEEEPALPADNIDNEMVNYTRTDAENYRCMEYYSCISETSPPEPLGSLRKGFYFSPALVKKACRFMKNAVSCYIHGVYDDCPAVTESVKSIASTYSYVCVEPGRSDIYSFLPCINNFDVQMSLMRAGIGFSYSMEIVLRWPDPAHVSMMACQTMERLYDEVSSTVQFSCSERDRSTAEGLLVASLRVVMSKYNCSIGENNETTP